MDHRYGNSADNAAVLLFLREQKARDGSFTVLDVGASANPWTHEVLDATFDLDPPAENPGSSVVHFGGNINRVDSWGQVLDYVSLHGKFSYAVCAHTLEDVAYPIVALDMLPQVAKAGFISMLSYLRELTRGVEGPWRGYIHHRWIFKARDGSLLLVPKVPFLEYSPIDTGWCDDARAELQIHWSGCLPYAVLNNDYLGPNVAHVAKMYEELLRSQED